MMALQFALQRRDDGALFDGPPGADARRLRTPSRRAGVAQASAGSSSFSILRLG
jgi:hypothetical protein